MLPIRQTHAFQPATGALAGDHLWEPFETAEEPRLRGTVQAHESDYMNDCTRYCNTEGECTYWRSCWTERAERSEWGKWPTCCGFPGKPWTSGGKAAN